MAATTISRATLTDSVSSITGDIWNAALVGTAIYDKIDALFTASLTMSRSSSGAIVFTTEAASNTSGSDATLLASVAGTSGGDPLFQAKVTSGTTWTWGVDNSDSDRFKLARGSALGTSTQNFLWADQITLADAATSALGTGAITEGFLMVFSDEDNASAMFDIRGGSGAVTEVLDPQTLYTITAATAASINVYWSAGNSRYEIENKRGGSRTFRLIMFGQG